MKIIYYAHVISDKSDARHWADGYKWFEDGFSGSTVIELETEMIQCEDRTAMCVRYFQHAMMTFDLQRRFRNTTMAAAVRLRNNNFDSMWKYERN